VSLCTLHIYFYRTYWHIVPFKKTHMGICDAVCKGHLVCDSPSHSHMHTQSWRCRSDSLNSDGAGSSIRRGCRQTTPSPCSSACSPKPRRSPLHCGKSWTATTSRWWESFWTVSNTPRHGFDSQHAYLELSCTMNHNWIVIKNYVSLVLLTIIIGNVGFCLFILKHF